MKIYYVAETCKCWFHCDCQIEYHGHFINGKNAEKKLKSIKHLQDKNDSYIYIGYVETEDE